MRARLNYALALGPSTQADVQEAAKGEPKESCQNCAKNADHEEITGKVEYTASRRAHFNSEAASCTTQRQTKE